jgi:protease II
VKGSIETFEFCPAADLLVFAADLGGDELMRLYFTDSTGKDPVALFPDDPRGTRADFVRWADDGRTLLYTSNRRDAKSMDLYEHDVASTASRILWQSPGDLAVVLSSRDHRRFILPEELSDAKTNLYLLDRGTAGAGHSGRKRRPRQEEPIGSVGRSAAHTRRAGRLPCLPR